MDIQAALIGAAAKLDELEARMAEVTARLKAAGLPGWADAEAEETPVQDDG